MRHAQDLWKLPGMPAAQLNDGQHRVPLNAERRVLLDSGFAVIIWLFLLSIIGARWPERPDTRGRWTLTLLAMAAATGYLASDLAENVILSRCVLPAFRTQKVTARAALALDRSYTAKWGFIAAAGLLIAAMLQRRTPVVRAPEKVWSGDPAVRPGAPESTTWVPAADRCAIALSGGGVRSASYCLGALQELRRRGVVQKARYVTAVSGGGYMAGAFTALNYSTPPNPAVPNPAPYASDSPEVQRLRRSLRYIATDTRVLASAIARIVFGVFLNLWLLYALIFAVVRPVGWLIGTPFGHRELRIEQDVVVEAINWSAEAGLADADQRYRSFCGITAGRPDKDSLSLARDPLRIAGDPDRAAWQVHVAVPQQCLALVRPPSGTRLPLVVGVTESAPGVVALTDGKLGVERQPVLKIEPLLLGNRVASHDPDLVGELASLVTVLRPELKVTESATGLTDQAPIADFVKLKAPAELRPVSILDRRRPFDIDARHVTLPAVALAVSFACFAFRVVRRPRWWSGLNRVSAAFGLLGIVGMVVQVVAPWLVHNVPTSLTRWLSTAPPAALGGDKGLPFPLPPLLAWPVLSLAAIRRFTASRKAAGTASKPQAANSRALLRKLFAIVKMLLVTLLLGAMAALSALTIATVGALNGPSGDLKWVSTEVLKSGIADHLPNDFVRWILVVSILLLLRGVGEASSWSLGPIYKRRLAWAYAWGRQPGGGVERMEYGPDFPKWEELVGDAGSRNGYVDGHEGDGTELVLCCAANVLGEDRAPTGRRAVSLTMSRSYIGGPEIGWMRTREYVDHMGTRRHWDVTLPGAMALSGAAASPAMGKTALGPYGSVMAVLNVRLGAWLPHPAWVRALRDREPAATSSSATKWKHNPGWPWYLREVLRRHKGTAPYLYVTDGGHWENLGLVEALRRGCTTIVVVSAAGDGDLSNATLAEAVEIARSDLGVEVQLDDVWKMRPSVGGDAPVALPSGRQYVLNPGPAASIGRAARKGYAYGTFTYPTRGNGEPGERGVLLVLEASMIDNLPVDVHAYGEGHPEFPNASTGDQMFTNRDFESYRALGVAITAAALDDAVHGPAFTSRVARCTRVS